MNAPTISHRRKISQKGFTLVEMIVAVGLFGVVMVVSITSLIAVIDANRKAQGLQSVINNLNIAIDGMTRAIREGSNYDASVECLSGGGAWNDCAGGGTSLHFDPFGPQTDWLYSFHDNKIYKSTNGGTEVQITSDEVHIDSMKFYLIGSTPGSLDFVQPKVMIVIKGTVGGTRSVKERSTFHVQSTAVQRVLDI